ncbi:siphovirus ReqiPepy6 Gp37-like family protein [Psychrobacillus sp. FSL K6-1464]|uniref:siphovirus ReqiPepy6 Gp37-like family protein n=1 Tax=Psychrobacillus sp. FSL K6-1464 TaxID=2921545 RepID=UPI0030F576AA
MSLPIRVMTRHFQLINEVNLYSSLQITRSWHGIGALELRINRYLPGASKLIKGRIIFPHNKLNKAYVIKHCEIELDASGKASENWIIRALRLKSWTNQRITYPPSTTAYDNKQDNAENVMRHYVTNNIINPVDDNRRMKDIILSVNQMNGENISWQSRYKNLAEELAEISLLSGLGWNIEIDIETEKYVFKVLKGRNLSTEQSILTPAIFSPEFNTLGQISYAESELNFRNYAVVAGQGEGIERRIVEVGESSGHDRYELFVDARDVLEVTDDQYPALRTPEEIEADLINRGNQTLTEYVQEVYLEGQALTKSRLEYEKDYDLGDIVTLQNREWGITRDARITEVKEIYEPSGKQIELVFDNSRPTLISKIKQQMSGIKAEITK